MSATLDEKRYQFIQDDFKNCIKTYKYTHIDSNKFFEELMMNMFEYKNLYFVYNRYIVTFVYKLKYLKTNKQSDIMLDSIINFMQYCKLSKNKNIIKHYKNRENVNPLDCGSSFYTIPLKEEIVNYLMYWVSTQIMINV